ncbi:MAG: hypothetical protein ACHP7N_06365 [Caulobacterales bacterium]
MRWTVVVLVVVSLAGCRKGTLSGDSDHHGRYVGIGIYEPQAPWTKMVAAQQPAPSAAAKSIDDQAVIVVEDSSTGEVRACGDMTGYCIGMNPWKKPLLGSQIPPINLTEHVKPPPADTIAPSTNAADNEAAPAPR